LLKEVCTSYPSLIMEFENEIFLFGWTKKPDIYLVERDSSGNVDEMKCIGEAGKIHYIIEAKTPNTKKNYDQCIA
jgi:hypothetical protein